MDGVDGLVIDTLPKCLKFLFLEIRVEWVRLYGSLVVDFRKLSVAEDTAYQGYYLICRVRSGVSPGFRFGWFAVDYRFAVSQVGL